MNSLVMTLMGADRPGLVGRLASVVAAQGGNWLESRMAHLGGQFAGILQIDVPPEKTTSLIHALLELERDGLRVVVGDGAGQASAARDLMSARLDLMGHDRPGIVAEISRVLADHQVNVEEWNTQRVCAAMPGDPIFQARGRVGIPRHVDLAEFREELEKIGHDMMVEVALVIDDGDE